MVFHYFRRSPKRLRAALAILLSFELGGAGLQAQTPTLPDGGVVRSGSAQISTSGAVTQIDQASDRAIIDWRSFGIGAGGQVVFVQPSARSATLNRVTGEQVSVILGRLDANGQVLLVNPNGVLFGRGAQINVGSLIATTSNLSDVNFMAGRLVFDQPGRPGAGILNAGALTAAEGGLVALVAPHVRNDGVIVARLGRVLLGAADTFTVDLYGDALINLALSDVHAGQLRSLNGEPVGSLITNTGAIETAGGRTVLMTARNAKNVLDNLINMSGTIKADTAVELGGRILLLGEGGNVDVSGTLSARGATGGSVEVLGDRIHVASTAGIDASGANGGGVVHIGGAFQGQGDTYRSTQTTVDAGATIKVNGGDRGNGGEAVVWSDGRTAFAGAIEAMGGANGGDGGRMEVSGKGTLAFLGQADASAAAGQSGSLLLDPAFIDIDALQAGVITRVLRTGTSTTLAADVDINVNSAITGGDRTAGGGLTMTAGNNINVNDFVVTNNGAINLSAAQGTVNVAPGKAVFAGTAPITVTTGGSVRTAPLITSGALSIASTAGSVHVDSFIDGHTGPVSIRAAGDVDIDQPIVNLASGTALEVTAGKDINVNAQVDGRGETAGGAVTMTAARDLNVNESIVTNDGGIALAATTGTINVASGAALVAGTGAVAMSARGDITSGAVSGGALTMASAAGSVAVNGLIDSATGDARIDAAADVNINQPILNGQNGKALAVNAGRDVNVNAQIDGRGGAPGGAVALTAARDLNVNQWLATNGGAITLNATGGTATVAADKGLLSGSGAITMRSAGDLTAGAVSGGSFTAASSGGSVRLNGLIDGATGRLDVTAASDVLINQPVLSLRTGNSMNVTAGRDIALNAQIDGRNGAAGGGVTLTASREVAVNSTVITNNGAIGITATGGAARMAPGTALVSGGAPVAMTAGGDVTTRGISAGSFSATSTGGSVNVNGAIDGGTGRVDLNARGDVNINQPVLNIASGAPFNATAGNNINVNAQIDGSAAARSGAATLAAGRDVNVNAAIVTRDSAISLSAVTGQVSVGTAAGLFAGSGTISETSGQTLTPGITSTTGALNFRSTQGGVNINTAIGDTTGAVSITAVTTVNINQAITNLKSGANLSVAAGADINVAAQVDGRGGVAGGAVTMTAGNNLNVTTAIATNNGAVALTATAGSVTVPTGVENMVTPMEWIVSAGNAPVSITSGGNFSLNSPIDTTGSLAITSTSGNVNIAAPITDKTGAVTITAGNGLTLNHQVKSDNKPIVLNAGAGGITVNTITDFDQTLTSPVNSGSADLTFKSVGNVSILESRGIATTGTLTIDTRGQILSGSIGDASTSVAGRPQSVILNADGGIAAFSTGFANSIAATSSGGSITMTVSGPDKLRITTGTTGTTDCPACDINLDSSSFNRSIGPDVALNAGGSVNLSDASTTTLDVKARSGDANFDLLLAGGAVTVAAGRDVTFGSKTLAGTLSATAGRDVALSDIMWIGNTPGDGASGGPLALTAGRDIVTTASSPIHVSNGQTLTLTAGQNVTLNVLETLGAVDITATNGNVTLNNDIGPHIVNLTGQADFNPLDLGVASLSISAPASTAAITMQGARAEGNVTISTGGSLTAAKQITSVGGTVTIPPGGSVGVTPIGSQNQLTFGVGFVSPVASPGPKAALPTAPGVASGGSAGLPALAEIPVAAADQIIGGVIRPGAVSGNVGVPGAPGGAGAPNVAGASSDAGNADPASALRDAEQDCGKADEQVTDTGLDAVKSEKSSQSTDKKNAACAAAPAAAAAPDAAPGGTTTSGPTTGSAATALPSGARSGGGPR